MLDMTVLLGAFVLGTMLLAAETLTISGIASYEIRDLREDFAGAEPFLVPKVIAAARPWRHVLRITPIVLMNSLWAIFLVYGLGLEADGWLVGALVSILGLEWLVIAVVRWINARKYRRDIEECKLLIHPDNLRVVGILDNRKRVGILIDRLAYNPYGIEFEDRPSSRPFRAGHFVRGGRLIPVDDVEEMRRVFLYLPFNFYGTRPVEETDIPVVVFYQPWSKSGFVQDADCKQAIGVYVGFRLNPAPNVESDISTEEAVVIGRVLADNGEGP